ncbi:MAG: hypothetical protein ACU836_16375 [Gammaproteobacteria bacterium]
MDHMNPALWQESGGLIGLVILALFILIGLFLRATSEIISDHRNDIEKLLNMHAEEREGWWKMLEESRRESEAVLRENTIAINRLAMRHRRDDPPEVR